MSTDKIANPTNYQLQAVIPDRFAVGWKSALVCGLYVFMFLYFGYLPAASPDIWSSIVAGANKFQATSWLPLADGIRSIDLAPIGNRLISVSYQVGGLELLTFQFAFVVTASLLVWSSVCSWLTARSSGAFGGIVVGALCLPFFHGLTPAVLGWFLLSVLAFCLVRQTCNDQDGAVCLRVSEADYRYHVATVLLLAVWANIHGSFVIGLSWLGCFVVARFATLVRVHNIRATCTDRELQSRVWLLEFATLATLLTPNGINLWKSLLWWPDNPFANTFGGYAPMVLASWSGAAIVVAWVVAVIVIRQRTVSLEWFLPPIALSIVAAFCSSVVFWFVPVMAFALCAVTGEPVNTPDRRVAEVGHQQRTLKFGFTLVAGLFIWTGICLAPWSGHAVGGKTRSESQLIGAQFPAAASEYLAANANKELFFCPASWSDWLQVRFDVPVFMSANTIRLPQSTQRDYQLIYEGEGNWKRVAQKYALTQLLVDRKKQPELVRRIRQDPGEWRLQYEDDQVLFLTTKS